MLKIRLQRVGRKHDPSFRVVLVDSRRSTKSGSFLEVLGAYDARKGEPTFSGDKIKEWVKKGAQLSGSVNNLLVKHKVITGKKMNVAPSPKKKEAVAPAKAEAKAEEKKEEKAEKPAEA